MHLYLASDEHMTLPIFKGFQRVTGLGKATKHSVDIASTSGGFTGALKISILITLTISAHGSTDGLM